MKRLGALTIDIGLTMDSKNQISFKKECQPVAVRLISAFYIYFLINFVCTTVDFTPSRYDFTLNGFILLFDLSMRSGWDLVQVLAQDMMIVAHFGLLA